MKKIKRLRINLLLNYPLGVELAFFVVLYKLFFTFALIPYFILCLCVSYLIRCLFLEIKYRNVWLSQQASSGEMVLCLPCVNLTGKSF